MADEVQATLGTDARADEVRGDERDAGGMGVTGVPFFVIDQRYAIAGAQPADVLLGAMQRAHEDAEAAPADQSAPACGPDGCELPAHSE